MSDDDHARWKYEIDRDHAQRAHDRNSELFDTANAAAIKSAEEAIKAGILMNGGSSVAMLAFIGTLASKDQLVAQQITLLAKPMICFASGVVAAVVCACFAYLTNIAVARVLSSHVAAWEHPYVKEGPKSKRHRITAIALRWIAMFSMTVSIGCFMTGVVLAKSAFEQLPQHARTMPSANTP